MSTAVAQAILAELSTLGVEVVANGDRLRYRPRFAVSNELRNRLVEQQETLIGLLREEVTHPAGNETTQISIDSPFGHDATSEPTTITIERWPLTAERGLSRCQRCGGPIQFAKVVADERSTLLPPKQDRAGKGVGSSIVLDPDDMPHGCGGPRAGRIIVVGAEGSRMGSSHGIGS